YAAVELPAAVPLVPVAEVAAPEIRKPPEIVTAAAQKDVPKPWAVAATAPRQPSRFESAAQEILLKIWHWIIVGEEHRPAGVSMGLMALITVCSGALAVRFNALLVAILGILGGYGTPVMLSTGVINFPGLFAYELLLGCGVLGVSYYKKWHLLNYLSFVCNYVLFFGAMTTYQVEDFWQVMPFLTAFFALF